MIATAVSFPSPCSSLPQAGIELLQTPDALQDENVVHDLRVMTKRLRAAWSMIGELAGRELTGRRRQSLRHLSSLLAGLRDQVVLEALLAKMASHSDDFDTGRAIELLIEADRLDTVDSPTRPCLIEMETLLNEEISAWSEVDFSDGRRVRQVLRRSLRRSTAKARRGTRKALADCNSEVWHNWRKTVKRLRYQREFIAEIQVRCLGVYDRRITRLGSLLGERNDLANLSALIKTAENTGSIPSKQIDFFRREIIHRERRLMNNSRRLGRIIFLR